MGEIKRESEEEKKQVTDADKRTNAPLGSVQSNRAMGTEGEQYPYRRKIGNKRWGNIDISSK